jgi:hypothetical protein
LPTGSVHSAKLLEILSKGEIAVNEAPDGSESLLAIDDLEIVRRALWQAAQIDHGNIVSAEDRIDKQSLLGL